MYGWEMCHSAPEILKIYASLTGANCRNNSIIQFNFTQKKLLINKNKVHVSAVIFYVKFGYI